ADSGAIDGASSVPAPKAKTKPKPKPSGSHPLDHTPLSLFPVQALWTIDLNRRGTLKAGAHDAARLSDPRYSATRSAKMGW
ncbi:MAG TPA: hypothetical protein VG222_08520, partial [Vicinamibacterales bacterium]|nr:hypothetical protein [Vicinamibacterales bacterium]